MKFGVVTQVVEDVFLQGGEGRVCFSHAATQPKGRGPKPSQLI